MIADLLTKALSRALFVALLTLLIEFAATDGRVVLDVPQRGSSSGGAPASASGGAITGPHAQRVDRSDARSD